MPHVRDRGEAAFPLPSHLPVQFHCTSHSCCGSLSASTFTSQPGKSLTHLGCLSPFSLSLSFSLLFFFPFSSWIERGSMCGGSHLFGQSTLLIAWHRTIHLQPCSVVQNCFLWKEGLCYFWMSCNLADERGASLGGSHFPVNEALHFQPAAAGGVRGHRKQDWYISQQYSPGTDFQSLGRVHFQLCFYSLSGKVFISRLPRCIK